MPKELIVSASSLEKKLAILEDDQVTQIFIDREESQSILGNVYKGRVTRVLPGMQAAFVDIGLERNAFLYVTDFFEDYEEYADLFKISDVPSVESPEEETSTEQRRTRRTRRGRRGQPRRESGEPVKAERKAEPPPTDSVPPGTIERPTALPSGRDAETALDRGPAHVPPRKALEVASLLLSHVPQILPRELEVDSRLEKLARSGSDSPANFSTILPVQLETSGTEGEVRPGKSRATRRRSPSRTARVRSKPPVMQFAVGKGGNDRSRKRTGSGALIADLLKEGQEILVQIAKEPIGKKGARITSHIVLPGRFIVFMPTVNHVGVSRRIESSKERQRLRETILDLRGDVEKGFIVRTAGEGRSTAELRQDMVYLSRLWEQIKAKADRASGPALIHTELDVVQRVVRDYFSEDFRVIRVDDEEEYERVVDFINNFSPDLVNRVRMYNKRKPIFEEFGINAEIERALKSKVWLRNGGYIVINQTEALVAIDVNTGKYVGRTSSLEDTIAKTNLDAVREVVRQIRLRDLGGIIIVDFIDMNDPRNQQKVLEALQNELRHDKSPSKVLPFNEFGLVAITRKRAKQSLDRALCQPCSLCEGTGMTKSVRTVCYAIYDDVRRALPTLAGGSELIIRSNPEVSQALRTTEVRVHKELNEMARREISIISDPLLRIEQFDLIET